MGDDSSDRLSRGRDRVTLWSSMQPLNIQYFDVTVRVGCSLVYEVTGTASLLLNLKLCPDRNHAVLSEALALETHPESHFLGLQSVGLR